LKLRSHLTLIVFGTLLPVLVLTVVLIVLYHTQMRRVTEVSLEDNARALASGVDRELDASIGALQVLAVSDALRVGNLRSLTAWLVPSWPVSADGRTSCCTI